MSKAKQKPTVTASCPMCRKCYPTLKARPSPTCGNPNCIREARARGLPFAVPPRSVAPGTSAEKKETKGKRGKS